MVNQYDYISFIIDNYDNLPKMSYFIKGNMFSKDENYYTTRERFEMLDSEELFSGWQDKQLLVGNYSHTNTTPLEVLQGGRLRQPIGWCSFGGNTMESRYFADHTSLIENLFENPPSQTLLSLYLGLSLYQRRTS